MANTVNYTVSVVLLPAATGAGAAALNWAGLSAHQVPGTVGPDTFVNTGREIFYVKNTGADMTVTFNSISTCNYGSDHDPVVAVSAAAGMEQMVGPFPPSRFGSSVTVTLSRLTAVVCDVLQLPFSE
jgi:hypothetical protein